MAKKYHKRAKAISALLRSVSGELDKAGGYSDRAAIIIAAVQIINTLLYTFDFAPNTYKNIDTLLNDEFTQMSDESDINRFTPHVKKILDDLSAEAESLLDTKEK